MNAPHASDAAHVRADRRAVNESTRHSRTATHARFVPLDEQDRPMPGHVDVACRVRVSTRWTRAEDAERCNLLVATIDDRDQGAPLLGHMRWRIETWAPDADADDSDTHHGADGWGQPAGGEGWRRSVDFVVDLDAATMTPGWVELEGWLLPKAHGYNETIAGQAPPPWLTRSPASPGPAAAVPPSSTGDSSP